MPYMKKLNRVVKVEERDVATYAANGYVAYGKRQSIKPPDDPAPSYDEQEDTVKPRQRRARQSGGEQVADNLQ